MFARRVEQARAQELAALAVRKYLDALCVYFWAATNLLFSLTTFGLYALMGQPLTAGTVFTSLALFNVLLGPLNSFPWVINGVVEAGVSVRRLGQFLGTSERVEWADARSSDGTQNSGGRPVSSGIAPASDSAGTSADGRPSMGPAPAIRVAGGCFCWASSSMQGSSSKAGQLAAPWVLRDVDLAIPAGSLVAVTGEVGSGKSSLLAAVLGEMACLAGSARLAPGRVAFVPQDPWLMGLSIRCCALQLVLLSLHRFASLSPPPPAGRFALPRTLPTCLHWPPADSYLLCAARRC